MSDDKIAEIRARHSRDDRWRNLPSMICPQAHDDRALLLAEIERLNKDLATQQGCCDGAAAQDAHVRREREEHRAEVERQRAEIERLRAALGGIRIDGPDADGLVWATIQHPDIAARSHVAVYPVGKTIRYLCSNLPDGRILMEPEVEECAPELERQRAEIERLRKALQDIAEDCDDDYPPSHGAIKYAVQDALRDKP